MPVLICLLYLVLHAGLYILELGGIARPSGPRREYSGTM